MISLSNVRSRCALSATTASTLAFVSTSLWQRSFSSISASSSAPCSSSSSALCSSSSSVSSSSSYSALGSSSSLLPCFSSLFCVPRRHLIQYESRVHDYKAVVRPMRIPPSFHRTRDEKMLSEMDPEDRAKTEKLMKTYQKSKHLKKLFVRHVNNEREKAKRLGLPTPEQKLLRLRNIAKRQSQWKRRMGRNPPVGFHARLLFRHLKQSQPTTRELLQKDLLGKVWTQDDPFVKELWERNEREQYRRLTMDELTMKTPLQVSQALKACINKKLVLAKNRRSPILADRLSVLYGSSPSLKENENRIHSDDKHWWLVTRDNVKENREKRAKETALKIKIKAAGMREHEEGMRRKAVNDVEREKNRVMVREHRIAAGQRMRLAKRALNHKRQVKHSVPARRPGHPRMPFEERRKLFLAEKREQKLIRLKAKIDTQAAAATVGTSAQQFQSVANS